MIQSEETMIEIVVAVEEPLLRLGTKAALDEVEDFRVRGTAGTLKDTEATVRELKPQVLLMDVGFQRQDRGMISRLVSEDPELKVLVVVEHSDEECSIRALLADPRAARFSEEALEHLDECCLTSLRSSARGCVARTSKPEHLVQAVRSVVQGEIAAAPWITALFNAGPAGTPAPAPISVRELDVIGLVADGKGNKEIARILGIREQTVKNHVASIMQKLGARSRLEVGVHAVRQNLQGRRRGESGG